MVPDRWYKVRIGRIRRWIRETRESNRLLPIVLYPMPSGYVMQQKMPWIMSAFILQVRFAFRCSRNRPRLLSDPISTGVQGWHTSTALLERPATSASELHELLHELLGNAAKQRVYGDRVTLLFLW